MKHARDPSALAEAADRLRLPLAAPQLEMLELFETLIRERAIPAGMVAAADRPRVRERHIVDSLRAAAVVDPSDRDAYDLGSGAGLPGIVVAIACPWLAVRLVEARARRAAFLDVAIAELPLPNATVVAQRLERVRDAVDICFARALAPLPRAWGLAEPLLRGGGRLVYFAGRGTVLPDEVAGRPVAVSGVPVLESGGPLAIMAR